MVMFAHLAHHRRTCSALPTESLSAGIDGRENHRRRALNAIQRTRQSLPVAAIQVNVVA